MSGPELAVLAAAFCGMVGMWWWGHPPTSGRIGRLERRVKDLETKPEGE